MARVEPRRARRGVKRSEAPPPGRRRNELLETAKSFAVAVVLFLLIRTFLLQAFSIPSASMENTLLIGDYLMANNAIFGAHIPFTDARTPAFRDPRHGDIVVFRPTYNRPVIDVVKRVIGEPGDTVAMRDGVLLRNGVRVVEPYLRRTGAPDEAIQLSGEGVALSPEIDPARYGYKNHLAALAPGVDRRTYRPTRDDWGPLVVPAGRYFLMGDNRDESLDSRFMGFIPREVIRGKPTFVYFSYNPLSEAAFPRFLTAARWGRIGHVLQ